MALPVFVKQEFNQTPHRNPTKDEQSLCKALGPPLPHQVTQQARSPRLVPRSPSPRCVDDVRIAFQPARAPREDAREYLRLCRLHGRVATRASKQQSKRLIQWLLAGTGKETTLPAEIQRSFPK
jgi:hypothetical protein